MENGLRNIFLLKRETFPFCQSLRFDRGVECWHVKIFSEDEKYFWVLAWENIFWGWKHIKSWIALYQPVSANSLRDGNKKRSYKEAFASYDKFTAMSNSFVLTSALCDKFASVLYDKFMGMSNSFVLAKPAQTVDTSLPLSLSNLPALTWLSLLIGHNELQRS